MFREDADAMKGTSTNYFWRKKIEVKEAPVAGKSYNTFSRPCKDDMPHPGVPVFSRGKSKNNQNEQSDKAIHL